MKFPINLSMIHFHQAFKRSIAFVIQVPTTARQLGP